MVDLGQFTSDNQIQVPDEVEIARQSLASLNPGDEGYLSALDALAGKLLNRFSLSGNPNDIDEAVARSKLTLDLSPPGHSFHLGALSNTGNLLLRRFKFRGDTDDLTQAVSYFEAAVEASAPGQSPYLSLVANLASGLLSRYRLYGDVKDLDRVVETNSTALSTSSTDGRDVALNNLGNALMERFTKQGNSVDLETALSHYNSCLALRPLGHPSRYLILGNLADAMHVRFEREGHLQDLESSINYYVSALQLRSPGQVGYLSYLTGLGSVLLLLYNKQGDTQRLDTAIACFQMAMGHSAVPNLDHSRLLDSCGAALQSRYALSGNIDDLDRAIEYLTTSSEIQPLTYPGRPNTLFNLGAALFTRFSVTNNTSYLDSSIEKLASALQLCEPGFHQRPLMLSVYGRSLATRFQEKGDLQDLHLAISTCRDALTLSSPEQSSHPSVVANLTSTLLDCFRKSGDVAEIQAIIEHCDRTLISTQPTEPAFLRMQTTRAGALLEKFQLGKEVGDVNSAIQAFSEVTSTLPESHTENVPVQLQFGIALQARFKLSADPKDLDEAIAHYRVARRRCKRSSVDYVPVCMQLGNALHECFEFRRDGDALDEAIVLLAEVEEVMSPTPGHANYKASLVNLAVALFARFCAQRNRDDLDTAIEHVSRALTLPTSAEDFTVSFALATCLCIRYDDSENLEDLEQSVELFKTVSDQMPVKHISRVYMCQNYARALLRLGPHRNYHQHLDTAINLYLEALQHLPPSHYDHSLTCIHLAEALQKRGLLLLDTTDLESAMTLITALPKVLPEGNPMYQAVYHVAAKLSMSMYDVSKKVDREITAWLEEGFRYYEQAASHAHFHGSSSVQAALDWALWAEKHHHSSALLAYETCLASLNQHLLQTTSIKDRHTALLGKPWVQQTGTLATDATACGIAVGNLSLAVELSEQGRGLLWSQLAQNRTPLDVLRSSSEAGPGLASDFERVSTQLAQRTIAESELRISPSRLTMEGEARQYRQLSRELDAIVGRIRQQDGLQTFLSRATFESLKHAAVGGPVILVNVSKQRCDAVIVLHDAPPRLVPLPNTSLEDLTALSAEFYHMLKTTRRVGDEKTRERQVVVVLRTLWDTVVRPIADDLNNFLPRGARIWWCPTSKLTSLPLHAAGPYRKGAHNLASMFISSYTPTLAALIRARQRPMGTRVVPPAFIAIGQADPSPQLSSTSAAESLPRRESTVLQTVDTELGLVRTLLPPTMPFSSLSGSSSTADAVLTALGTHAWVHLACHGRPNVEKPFDASFALKDRAVTVLDVIRGTRGGRTSRGADIDDVDSNGMARGHVHVGNEANADGANTNVKDTDSDGNANSSVSTGHTGPIADLKAVADREFAFLSACHTAVGDRTAPDEIIHLAAAMQFAGFRSVIGTMWAVDDAMVTAMVKAFYESLFASGRGQLEGNGKGANQEYDYDCTQAARALNKAAKSAAKEQVSLDQRIVFVHIGA